VLAVRATVSQAAEQPSANDMVDSLRRRQLCRCQPQRHAMNPADLWAIRGAGVRRASLSHSIARRGDGYPARAALRGFDMDQHSEVISVKQLTISVRVARPGPHPRRSSNDPHC
jgi:hypothetical protein